MGATLRRGRWIDVYLLVAPAVLPSPVVPVGAVAATVAVLAAMALVGRRATGN